MPVCPPVTVICSISPAERAARVMPPWDRGPGRRRAGRGVMRRLVMRRLVREFPVGRLRQRGAAARHRAKVGSGDRDRAGPAAAVRPRCGGRPALPNRADQEPKNAKKPLTTAGSAASTSELAGGDQAEPAPRWERDPLAGTGPGPDRGREPSRRNDDRQPDEGICWSSPMPLSPPPACPGAARGADPVEGAGQRHWPGAGPSWPAYIGGRGQ